MDPISPVFRKVDRPMNEQLLLLLMGKVKLGRVSFLENKCIIKLVTPFIF